MSTFAQNDDDDGDDDDDADDDDADDDDDDDGDDDDDNFDGDNDDPFFTSLSDPLCSKSGPWSAQHSLWTLTFGEYLQDEKHRSHAVSLLEAPASLLVFEEPASHAH